MSGFHGDAYEFAVGSARGLRTFKFRSGTKTGLRGPVVPKTWTDGENVSVCRYNPSHRFNENCTCGFYSYHDGSNEYHNFFNSIPAVVENYGKVVIGDRGFRAEKSRLVAVVMPRDPKSEVAPWHIRYGQSFGRDFAGKGSMGDFLMILIAIFGISFGLVLSIFLVGIPILFIGIWAAFTLHCFSEANWNKDFGWEYENIRKMDARYNGYYTDDDVNHILTMYPSVHVFSNEAAMLNAFPLYTLDKDHYG